MIGRNLRRAAGMGLLVSAMSILPARPASAQKLQKGTAQQFVTVEQPDAQRTKNEFESLLDRYPPTVRGVFKEDPGLLTDADYIAHYPPLASFLSTHPEIPLNPAFYLGGLADSNNRFGRGQPEDHASRIDSMWDNFLRSLVAFAGFAMAIGLLTWLIRTFIDYRRWNRLSRVQAEVHTKLLDRFSTNEELLAYIATPAGSKFLQSAPISLDTGASSRSMGAPLNRIMWSVQAGLVLVAGGCGLMLASGRVGEDIYLPLEVMGILAVALGVGFAVSAGISYLLSYKMGLLDVAPQKRTAEPPEA